MKSAYILLILATFLWGIGGPIIKYSFQFVTPNEFLFWRFVIAIIVSLPFAIWYFKKHPLSKNLIPKVIILSLLGITFNLSLVFWGLNLTSIVEASIIGSLTPLLVAVAGALFLGERLTRRKEIGISLAISGTTLAVLTPILDQGFLRGQTLLGNLLILLGSLGWVCFVILSKKWESPSLKPFHIVIASSWVAVLGFFIISWAETGNPKEILEFPGKIIWAITYMAVFGTLIAFSLYELALKKIEAGQADLFNYLGPVWSIPLAIVWLGEKFEPHLILSAVLILTGVFLAETRGRLLKNLRGHHLAHHR